MLLQLNWHLAKVSFGIKAYFIFKSTIILWHLLAELSTGSTTLTSGTYTITSPNWPNSDYVDDDILNKFKLTLDENSCEQLDIWFNSTFGIATTSSSSSTCTDFVRIKQTGVVVVSFTNCRIQHPTTYSSLNQSEGCGSTPPVDETLYADNGVVTIRYKFSSNDGGQTDIGFQINLECGTIPTTPAP